MFESSSRYYGIKNAKYTTPDGGEIIYKSRRFLPKAEDTHSFLDVAVTAGDRLDLVTAKTLGDPEQFWRIADANNAMDPFDLTERPGRVLHIPNPQF